MVPEEERYFGKEVDDVKLSLPESKLPSQLHPYLQDVMAELVIMSIILIPLAFAMASGS